MSATPTITFSLSKRYAKTIEKILEELPDGEMSRFICQSMVDKYNSLQGVNQSSPIFDDFGFGKQEEPKVEITKEKSAPLSPIHKEEEATKQVSSNSTSDKVEDNNLKEIALFILKKNRNEIKDAGFMIAKVASGDKDIIETLLFDYPDDVMEYSTEQSDIGEPIEKVKNETPIKTEDITEVIEEKANKDKKGENPLKDRIKNW